MPDRRILRYEVPVDDDWHRLDLAGDPVHVATRRDNVVEVWAWSDEFNTPRWFRVYGTGHPIPGGGTPGDPDLVDPVAAAPRYSDHPRRPVRVAPDRADLPGCWLVQADGRESWITA